MIIGIDGNEANVKNRVGSNVYAYQLLRHLYGFTDQQFLVYLKKPALADMPEPASHWQYQVLKPAVLWTQWRLPARLFLSREVDVFFSPGHYSPSYCPVPLAVAVMDLAFLKYPDQFRKKDLLQLKLWTRQSIDRADKVLTISQQTRDDIIGGYQVETAKVEVVYPAVALAEKMIVNNQILDQHDLKKNDYLIYIGTLQPRKNLVRLIKAFAKLVKQPDLAVNHLVIVGKKGWLYEEIFQTVKDQGLTDRVVFTGFVEEEEKNGLLKNARAFILPSLYEGFGFPVLEAMKIGCPTVVAKTSSLPEVAGQAAIYIEKPKSVASIVKALEKALQLTEQERQELIDKGRKQAKKFSWQKTAKQVLAELKKLKDDS